MNLSQRLFLRNNPTQKQKKFAQFSWKTNSGEEESKSDAVRSWRAPCSLLQWVIDAFRRTQTELWSIAVGSSDILLNTFCWFLIKTLSILNRWFSCTFNRDKANFQFNYVQNYLALEFFATSMHSALNSTSPCFFSIAPDGTFSGQMSYKKKLEENIEELEQNNKKRTNLFKQKEEEMKN